MIRAPRANLCVLALALAGLLSSPTVTGGRMYRLPGHVPAKGLLKSLDLGRKNARERMRLSVMLKARDQAGLEEFVRRVHDPRDPLFGRFLTPREFGERFGASDEDIQAVSEHLESRGVRVKEMHANRLLLEVEGEARSVEHAFQVEMRQVRREDGKLVGAALEDPSMPVEVASRVLAVAGLSELTPRQPYVRRGREIAPPGPAGFTRASGLLEPRATIHDFMTPAKIRTAYNTASIAATGAGQTVALFQLDGYTLSDISTYATTFGLPMPTLENVLVGGFDGTPGEGAVEVTMDIQLVAALAPDLAKIIVYQGPNTEAGVLATYSRIANDNLAAQVSSSWGLSEDLSPPAMIESENVIFQQMAAQGQSMFAASGDAGAFDDHTRPTALSVDDPASQPYVTGVGGTTLFLTTANTRASETTWGISEAREGGGGGVSRRWTIPSYQERVGQNSMGHSSTHRMVPDVALNANPDTGYPIFYNGKWHAFGGTSAAAPLWAAFISLVNQQRESGGLGRLGFANAALYRVGESQQYPAAFHDIADRSTNLFFPAVDNYDLATGWGTINGAPLFSLLTAASPPAPLAAPSVPGNLQIVGTN